MFGPSGPRFAFPRPFLAWEVYCFVGSGLQVPPGSAEPSVRRSPGGPPVGSGVGLFIFTAVFDAIVSDNPVVYLQLLAPLFCSSMSYSECIRIRSPPHTVCFWKWVGRRGAVLRRSTAHEPPQRRWKAPRMLFYSCSAHRLCFARETAAHH